MADVVDPEGPPMHHDIVEDFSPGHVWLAGFLGILATVVRAILGVILVND